MNKVVPGNKMNNWTLGFRCNWQKDTMWRSWTLSPPAGWGGVQHREGSPGPDSEAEDHGVLREKGEADRAAEENVSHGDESQDTSSPPFPHRAFLRTKKYLYGWHRRSVILFGACVPQWLPCDFLQTVLSVSTPAKHSRAEKLNLSKCVSQTNV